MRSILVLTFLFVHALAYGQLLPDPALTIKRDIKFVPYRQKHKWGIMTQDKKWVLKPKHKFDSVSLFQDEVAVFKVNNKLGLIDTTGKIVLNPIYTSITYNSDRQFYELMQEGNPKTFCLYDKKLYQELPDSFYVDDFNHITYVIAIDRPDQGKMVPYRAADGKWGAHLKKKNGSIIKSDQEIPARYDSLVQNGQHYIALKDGAWGVVEDGNKLIIPFEYEAIKTIDFGSSYPVKQNGRWGILATYPEQKLVVPIAYDEIISAPFREGFGFRLVKNGSMGYYSLDTKQIIAPAYQYIKGFNNSKISTAISATGKFGYVGLDGFNYFED